MKEVIMKKLLFWMVLIVGTVALLGSCAKKEESTTTAAAAAAAAGVCTTCDPLTSTTTAAGSITVGSATLSGTYATSCFNDASDFSEGSAPSDMKSYGYLFIVRGNDNVTEELNYYTDSTCTTKGYTKKNVYDNVTVGSASGSNYQVALMYKQIKILVTTTVSEAWVDGIYGGSVDFVVDTEKIMTVSADYQQKFGFWNVSATTFEMGNTVPCCTFPSELNGVEYTKQ
jgi:hypothetical protein